MNGFQEDYDNCDNKHLFLTGILKEKFRILDNGMDFKLETSRMVVVALAMLYNISLDLGETPVQPEPVVGGGSGDVGNGEGDDEGEESEEGEADSKAAGGALRESLLRSF